MFEINSLNKKQKFHTLYEMGVLKGERRSSPPLKPAQIYFEQASRIKEQFSAFRLGVAGIGA